MIIYKSMKVVKSRIDSMDRAEYYYVKEYLVDDKESYPLLVTEVGGIIEPKSAIIVQKIWTVG